MKTFPLAVALALTAICTPALAIEAHEAGAAHQMHCKMDMAAMSPAEKQKKMDEMFASIDTNKDGSISKAEFTSHHDAMMKRHHDGMGKSEDGCKMDHGKMDMDHEKMEMKMDEKKDSARK